MTENDPSAQDPARRPADAPSGQEPAQSIWAGSPYPEQGATAPDSGATPYPATGEPSYHAVTGADPSYGAPNPWSPAGAQAPTQSVYPPPSPYGAPATGGTAIFNAPAPAKPARSGGGKLLAGVAAVALLVGGIAGGAVGYLTSDSNSGPVGNALDAPKPASQTGNAPAGSVEAVAQKLSPSVVELQVSGQSQAGEGSGFVISTDGYILTNNHVVEVAANGGRIQAVFQDGKKAPAKVIGRDPTTDIAVVKVDGVSGLRVGTEEPIQHGGGFVDMNAATVTTQRAVTVDVALLQASAPLLNLRAGAQLTANGNAIDLTSKAKVTNSAAYVALDQSRVIVNVGALVNASGGSFLQAGGNLINLANGSVLTINNGVLLSVSGGSIVNIRGALIAFSGSGGNTVNISNALAFVNIGGIPVALTGGALAANVSITGTPIKNPGLGTITPNKALIQVNGATSKLTISGN